MFSPLIVPQYGSWTPVITAETPGNLSVTYDVQQGRFIKIGKIVIIFCKIDTATFTHTTASGDCQVTGLPFPSISAQAFYGVLSFNNITKPGYTQFLTQLPANSSFVNFVGSASGTPNSKVAITQMPSGGEVFLDFSVMYETTN